MNKINYGKQYIDNQDIKNVTKILRSDIITRGSYVEKFENKISKYVNSKFTTVCNSGTSAILLAFLSINLKKNDIIIMPAINFVAAYNMATNLEAKVYLADVDKFTGQMKPEDIIECCKKFNLRKIKAITTQYHGGYPENVKQFYELKKKLKCFLIEDACHAFGSKYKIKNKTYNVGSCFHSDICTFSFHPLKTITTGEGGAITTNSIEIYKKIKLLRSNGIVKHNKYSWKDNAILNGYNFNLSDFQCALGISQLKKVSKFILKRKDIFNKYNEQLKNINNIKLVKYSTNLNPSYHLYFIHLKNKSLVTKNKFFNFMKRNNVNLIYHYIPIYKFKIFKGKYIGKKSEIYYSSSVSLPIYFSLNEKNQNYIISKIKKFFVNKK